MGKTRNYRVADNVGVAILRDRDVPALPNDLKMRGAILMKLESLSNDGSVFFIDGLDAINMSIQLVVEPDSPDLQSELRPVGRSYLLRLTSGHIRLSGLEGWESETESDILAEPGNYSVKLFSSEKLNWAEWKQARLQALGERDISFAERVNYLWFLGCLPSVFAAVLFLVQLFRGQFAAALLFTFLLWLPYFVLSRSKRYQSYENRRDKWEGLLPNFIVQLSRGSDEKIAGGYYRMR